MGEFLRDLQTYTFLQYALLAGGLSSISCGIIGSYVTVRRITYIAGAIAHCTLGGMGAARFLQKEHAFPVTPLQGAVAAALLAACIIAWFRKKGGQRQDTVLSAIWSIGMAIGIFFISKTGGYNEDLMSYLFGDILMVSKNDLILIAILDVFVVGMVLIFYNQLIAVCFDEEFARISGVKVDLFELLLLLLIAMTVVLLVQVVGIVMVVAMLTLPAAAAGKLVKQLWQMMAAAILLCLVCTTGGLAISYQPDFPTGATIVILAGAIYFIVLFIKKWR